MRDGVPMNPFGVRTREQLLAAGMTSKMITSRCHSGLFVRVLPQIYIVGDVTTNAHCFAVTQWQPLSILSHRTSAWLRGWLPEPAIVEATVPRSVRVRTPKWLRLYRRDLDPEVIEESLSMPIVRAEQTLVDCVAVMPTDEADRLVDAVLTRDVTVEGEQLLRKKNPGRWGNHKMAKQFGLAATDAASEPERILGRTFHALGFRLAANVPVGPYICDFVDERAKVIVEIDGREFHSEPEVFRNDRRRQNWLVEHGWLVLRFAAYDVLADPIKVARQVMAVVRRRRHSRST